MNPTTGDIDWGTDDAAEIQRLKDTFGSESALLKAEPLQLVVNGLNRQSSGGASTVTFRFIRRIFEDSPLVDSTLLPFLNAILTNNVCGSAMKYFRTCRVALIPKGEADWRALGIGGALFRIIERTVVRMYEKDVAQQMMGLQYAVGIRDAGAILPCYSQGVFNKGRVDGDECCDQVKMDAKGAFPNVKLRAVYEGLRRFCPELIRWFLLSYGDPTPLLHAIAGYVGRRLKGVLEGGPGSMLYWAVAVHPVIEWLNARIKAEHGDDAGPTTRACSYADDPLATGKGEVLLDLYPEFKRKMKDDVGPDLHPDKLRLLLGKRRSRDDPIFDRARDLGFTVVEDGVRVMGVPIGTDGFIEDDVGRRVQDCIEDLKAVKCYTAHTQWSMCLYCINARPVFLLRVVHMTLGTRHFEEFDRQLTDAVLRALGVDNAPRIYRKGVHVLRSLSQQLSGGTQRRAGEYSMRLRALRLARDSVGRHLKQHEPQVLGLLVDQWKRDTFRVKRIEPAAGFDDSNVTLSLTEQALKGHPLGHIPSAAVKTERIPGEPELDIPEHVARTAIKNDAFTAELVLHTGAIQKLANSSKKNQQLAAQCLSQSCVNSANALRWFPSRKGHIRDDKFVQMARMQFGVPAVRPLSEWTCDCRPGYRVDDAIARQMGGNADEPFEGVCFEDQPLHGLCCRRRHKSCIHRHDRLRDDLIRQLNTLDGVVATEEPRVGRVGQRRADIAVTKGGNKWYVDVGVTCPATQRMVGDRKTHLRAGAAAQWYREVKERNYRQLNLGNAVLVPFIVETGGRLDTKACEFIDTIAAGSTQQMRAARARIYKTIASRLVRSHMYMMAKILDQLRPRH